MDRLRSLFYRFGKNLAAVFRGRNLWWHALAIALTWGLVASGFDWTYFQHTRSPLIFALFIPAALLGFAVPVLTPLALFAVGAWRRSKELVNLGYALGQSGILAWLISSAYKAVTGRAHPALFNIPAGVPGDLSRIFQFGLLRGGIFWGWPSSHTMVAFAIAATAIVLVPKRSMKVIAAVYALYVGIGVSLTIHWFSDFAAGAILGTLVGVIVGRAFREREV